MDVFKRAKDNVKKIEHKFKKDSRKKQRLEAKLTEEQERIKSRLKE